MVSRKKKEKAERHLDVALRFLTLGCFYFCAHVPHYWLSFLVVWSTNDILRTVLSWCHHIGLHLPRSVRGSNVSVLMATGIYASQWTTLLQDTQEGFAWSVFEHLKQQRSRAFSWELIPCWTGRLFPLPRHWLSQLQTWLPI